MSQSSKTTSSLSGKLGRVLELAYLAGEYAVMTIVPRDAPGPLFRRLFRLPLLHYRLGLGRLIGGQILLLTTTGRVTGKPHTTPLGYTYDKKQDTYFVTAGWGGRTDWFLNLQAQPRAHIRVGNRRTVVQARPVPEDEYVSILAAYNARNPFAARMWPRLTGEPFDGSPTSLQTVARSFPMMALQPDQRA